MGNKKNLEAKKIHLDNLPTVVGAIIVFLTLQVVLMSLASCSVSNRRLIEIIDSSSAAPSKYHINVSFREKRSGVAYKNIHAINYAKKYASQNNNSCGKFFYDPDPTKNRSDCAHFIAHCLKAGGITISNPDPTLNLCPDGLAFRVPDLVTSLKTLDGRYNNVTEIAVDDAIIGDYGFLRSYLIRPSHAYMICVPARDLKDYKIYGHTTNRSCEKGEPSWYNDFYTAFRITDN